MDPIDAETRPEALYTIAIVALHADDEAHPAERRAIEEAMVHLPPLASLDERRTKALRSQLQTVTAPPSELAASCCAVLGEEDALQAFGLALDVVLADRDVDDAERDVLETVRSHLHVPEDEAERLIDLLETKHSAPLADLGLPKVGEAIGLEVEPPEALLTFPVAAAYAESEEGPLVLPPARPLMGLAPEEQGALLRRLTDGLDRFGREEFLRACADVLEDEEQRRQAFVLTAQTVHLDRNVSEVEATFLEEVRTLLEIPKTRAERILGSVETLHRS